METLQGKTALITGAANGIGLATVEHFFAEGAVVIAVDRQAGPVSTDPRLRWLIADVTDGEAMTDAVGLAQEMGGRLDICVANAGIGRVEDFLDGTSSSWRAVLDVNLLGVMTTLQAAARVMAADMAGGRLLATASIAGIRGEPHTAAYCASKGGVISLIQSLAVELARYGITANAVAPGQISTALNAADVELMSQRAGKLAAAYRHDFISAHVPAGRMGAPHEVAALFAYLASDAAGFISGATVRIDGAELPI